MNHSPTGNGARRMLVPVALGAAVVLVLAGCGSSASSSASTQGGSGAAASPPSVAVATSSPAPVASEPSSSLSASSAPSLPAVTQSHADPALEALLPSDVGNTPMRRSSATLAALVAAGANRAAIDGFLQGIGKTEADGTYAAAFDPDNVLGGGIFAFKVAGVNEGVLLPAILAVEQSDLGTGATTSQATVGGKPVTVVSVGDGVNDTEWVYAKDGVVFVIHAADEEHAAAFLQALS